MTRRHMIVPAAGLILFLAAIAAFMGKADLYFSTFGILGLNPIDTPFLDLSTLGADAECWKRGIDVYIQNPCDILGRPHNYSPLWLRATFIPTGPRATAVMGITLDTLFLVSLYWIVRPIRWPGTLLALLCCGSPMVIFALERGNADVLLFLFLVASFPLAAGPLCRRAIAYALILFAGLLKFYPLAALVLIARERPRWLLAFGTAAAAILAAFILAYKDELLLMKANIPVGGFAADLFGAANFPALLISFVSTNVEPPTLRILRTAFVVALMLAAMGAALAWSKRKSLQAAYDRLSQRASIMMTAGAALIVGCFFAGQSVNYRGIFLLFIVGSLIELHRAAPTRACRAALVGISISIAALMWESMLRGALVGNGTPDSAFFPVFLVIRELLWWNLVGFLLAMLALFAARADGLSKMLALAGRRQQPAQR